MSFELTNLDVMQAEQVLPQLVRRIQGYTPGWTDHNPSDPGITLLQLLVWICDGTGYTANAVPLETYRNMLRWVAGISNALSFEPSDNDDAADFPYAEYAYPPAQDVAYKSLVGTLEQMELGAPLGSAVLQEAAVSFRRAPFLAVTPTDFSALMLESNAYIDAQGDSNSLHVARLCLRPRGDVTDLILVSDAPYTYSDPSDDGSGTFGVSLTSLVVGKAAATHEATLLDRVREYLAPRALLGGGLSVSGAEVTYFDVQCQVRCFARERVDEVASAVLSALTKALQPVRQDGGCEWAYGARIDASVLWPVIGSASGVDRIENLTIKACQPAMLLPAGTPVPNPMLGGLPRLNRAQVTALEADDA